MRPAYFLVACRTPLVCQGFRSVCRLPPWRPECGGFRTSAGSSRQQDQHPQSRGTDPLPNSAQTTTVAIDLHKTLGGERRDALAGALLTRDFIAKSLYNFDTGYFSTKDVINDLPGPLEFGNMLGELHYRVDVKKAYESKLSAWMTPVETFSPHFSNALAKYIAREAKTGGSSSQARARKTYGRKGASSGGRGDGGGGGEGLVLYEAGGGTGTNALNILNWLRREEPRLYQQTEYTIIEISSRLAELQAERVCSIHKNCCVVNANVLEWGMSGDVDPRPCFFLGMELLDNLPHDKIAWTSPSISASGVTLSLSPDNNAEELCEAVVVQTPLGFQEAFRPLRDPVIRELTTLCPELTTLVKNPESASTLYAGDSSVEPDASFFGRSFARLFGHGAIQPEYRAAFVPTGSLRLVQALRKRLPRHRAILADFDSFVGTTEAGAAEGPDRGEAGAREGRGGDDSLMAFQAPIVSSRDSATGSVTDHATYMVPLGSADIFFPTCFKRLSRLHTAVCNSSSNRPWAGPGGGGAGGVEGEVRRRPGLVVKQGEFLREFADLRATKTFSGFNPLVDDFRNASVFLSGVVLP